MTNKMSAIQFNFFRQAALAIFLTGLISPFVLAALSSITLSLIDKKFLLGSGIHGWANAIEFLVTFTLIGMAVTFPEAIVIGVIVERLKAKYQINLARGGFCWGFLISIISAYYIIYIINLLIISIEFELKNNYLYIVLSFIPMFIGIALFFISNYHNIILDNKFIICLFLCLSIIVLNILIGFPTRLYSTGNVATLYAMALYGGGSSAVFWWFLVVKPARRARQSVVSETAS